MDRIFGILKRLTTIKSTFAGNDNIKNGKPIPKKKAFFRFVANESLEYLLREKETDTWCRSIQFTFNRYQSKMSMVKIEATFCLNIPWEKFAPFHVRCSTNFSKCQHFLFISFNWAILINLFWKPDRASMPILSTIWISINFCTYHSLIS